MSEYNFQITLEPESYDYDEEEIVYRILFDNQLISERSLPKMEVNQKLVDFFVVNCEELTNHLLIVNNIKSKKCKIVAVSINNKKEIFENLSEYSIRSHGLHLTIKRT
jgi:hypothetical protein